MAGKTSKKGARATAARESAPRLRRKNLILDQDRIDRARAALGAATETEAITRALDQAIDVANAQAQMDAVLTELDGRGLDIVNYSDDPEALDYSGFADVFPHLAKGLSTPEARAAAGIPPQTPAPNATPTSKRPVRKPARKPGRTPVRAPTHTER